MSRPLRNTNPEYLRLFTIRTFEQRFFLRPDNQTNQIAGGVIARYQEKYGIEIFAYVVLSNHIHMLLRAPQQNLWKFATTKKQSNAHMYLKSQNFSTLAT